MLVCGWIDCRLNLELYHSYNPNAVTSTDVINKRFAKWWSLAETLVGTAFKGQRKMKSPSGCFLFAGKSGSSKRPSRIN
jgi:hypothetical protein